jgi:hypothetical protein
MTLDDIRTALYVSKFTFIEPNINLGWDFASTKVQIQFGNSHILSLCHQHKLFR